MVINITYRLTIIVDRSPIAGHKDGGKKPRLT